MRPSSARERDAPLADIAIRATEEESARAAAAAAGGVGAGAKGALLDSAIDDQVSTMASSAISSSFGWGWGVVSYCGLG